jgi:hypothetical protein
MDKPECENSEAMFRERLRDGGSRFSRRGPPAEADWAGEAGR